jgi:hypothetical protein
MIYSRSDSYITFQVAPDPEQIVKQGQVKEQTMLSILTEHIVLAHDS